MSKELILQETQAIVDAETLLKTPVEQLNDETAMVAWSVLDLIEKKLLGERKKELRVTLFERAEASGEQNSKGSFIYELGDGKVTKERRAGKVVYNVTDLCEMLRDKGLSLDRAVTYMPKVNEEGLESLIVNGDITVEELQSITDVGDPVFALKVKKPKVVTNLLKGLK